ncbi:MAG: hypothetical protein WCT05_14390 [Lentisphaeria bacterium]
MEDHLQKAEERDKQSIFQAEFDKLNAIFSEVEESKQKLVQGLIYDAAFLYSENWDLRRMIAQTGSVVTNPKNPLQQKTLPAATQYLKNANSYAVVIKALNGVLSKNEIEPDDGMGEYE